MPGASSRRRAWWPSTGAPTTCSPRSAPRRSRPASRDASDTTPSARATSRLSATGWPSTCARGDGTASIHAVVSRRTRIQRRAPADHGAPMQVLAANVDVVMIATSLNRDLNARRLERFLATAWESGGRPIVVLTKVDLAANPVEVAVAEAQLEELAVGVRVLATERRDRGRARRRPPPPAARHHHRPARIVGGRQEHAHQRHPRRAATGDVGGPRGRRPGTPHDQRPAARAASRWRPPPRHARASASSRSGTTAPALRPPSWTWRRPRPGAASATAPTSGSPAVRSRQRS